MALNAQKIFSLVLRVVKELGKPRAASQGTGSPARRRPGGQPTGGAGTRLDYPGDYRGTIRFEYDPSRDGNADPGEIVWGWVPYEEDHSQGKDRPVLIVGRDRQWLLGLMLTSKDKNNADHRNPNYLDIGSGSWDRERRPSEVKLDRIIRVDASAVRREGAILDRKRFANVVNALNDRA